MAAVDPVSAQKVVYNKTTKPINRLNCLLGKEVIIVHDNHGGGGGAEYGAGTAAGWVSGHTATGWSTGGGADSYSAGSHIGGGDNTYAGGQDSYSSGKK